MRLIDTRNDIGQFSLIGFLGVALAAVVACSQGETTSTTGTAAPGGSAALQGPLVFVHNSTASTTSVLALKGNTGNAVIKTLGKGFPELPAHPNGAYNGNAPGDMQFSEGEWMFVNVGGIIPGPGVAADTVGSSVALIDPLSGATPIFEDLLQIGERPVHMYRDPTDGEVIWSMIDGNVTTGLDRVPATIKDSGTVVDCSATGGGAVTILHNSHVGSGGNVPKIVAKVCLRATGHKVTAFSSGAGVPKRAFVSSETAGEIAVIDNEPGSPTQWTMTHRIDLCNPLKEVDPLTCNGESGTPLTTAFTPNNAGPHGIRWSKLTQKVYSLQEGYGQIAEVDPTTLDITNTFDLAGSDYTSFGISPDGRFLLLRGQTTAPQATKLGLIDLSLSTPVIINLTNAALDAALSGTSPGAFKFTPDGKRFYILAGNAATTTKKDRLFAFDASTLTATPPALTLLREIPLTAGGDSVGFNAAHNIDVLAQGAPGAGEAKYIVVSNRLDNSVSIINATTNAKTQDVQVGQGPGSVMIYYPGAAAAGNQASN